MKKTQKKKTQKRRHDKRRGKTLNKKNGGMNAIKHLGKSVLTGFVQNGIVNKDKRDPLKNITNQFINTNPTTTITTFMSNKNNKKN